MLAIRVNEFGGPDVLRVEEVDIPRPRQDEILVRIVAAGVGPWDVSLRQGGYPGPLPYVAGERREKPTYWDHPTRPLTNVSALVISFSRAFGTENGSSVSTTRSARFPTSIDPRSFSIPHP